MSKMELKIIYEDTLLLALDKPAGWVVNEAKTSGENPVIQTWLEKSFDYPLAKSREERSGIVHRLDKETSGVLLVAKTREAFQNLQKQFKERKVKKTYLALVHGRVEPKIGEIRAPIARLPWSRQRFGVVPGGREAITRYKVLRYFLLPSKEFSLLEIYPKTGRTHQIRVHLRHIGHPIVSDKFYAGRKTAREDQTWCPRLFLHSTKISFLHPHTQKRVFLKSLVSEDLRACLDSLKKDPSLLAKSS